MVVWDEQSSSSAKIPRSGKISSGGEPNAAGMNQEHLQFTLQPALHKEICTALGHGTHWWWNHLNLTIEVGFLETGGANAVASEHLRQNLAPAKDA
jgi:hypothetical protein